MYNSYYDRIPQYTEEGLYYDTINRRLYDDTLPTSTQRSAAPVTAPAATIEPNPLPNTQPVVEQHIHMVEPKSTYVDYNDGRYMYIIYGLCIIIVILFAALSYSIRELVSMVKLLSTMTFISSHT
jgi:hypothetical protein